MQLLNFERKSVAKVIAASATAYLAFKTLRSILNYFKNLLVTSSIKGAPYTLFIGSTQITGKYGSFLNY